MQYPVSPRSLYIITPASSGTVTAAGIAEPLCTFDAGNQAWFHAPDGVKLVEISDDAAIITPLD